MVTSQCCLTFISFLINFSFFFFYFLCFRYIEIFRSSLAELKRSTGNGNGRMAPYDLKDRGSNRGGGGGGGNDYSSNNRNNRKFFKFSFKII